MTRRPRTERRHGRLGRVVAVLVIISAACLAAVGTAPRASGAVAEWIRTPPVETRTVALPRDGDLEVAKHTAIADPDTPDSPGEARARATDAAADTTPVTLDAGMRFTMLGVTCDVPNADGPVAVLLRTSLDGASWSPWVETPLEIAEEEDARPLAFTDPLWTGPARYVQVSAAAAGSYAPPELAGTRLVAIDPTEDTGGVARATNTLRHFAAAIAGLNLVPPASAAADSPTIVTRAEWGANESWRSGSPSYATVKMAFVHHTASGNTYTRDESAALVRGIYSYHTKSLGWSDIGYNFLVDRYGTIYEGRFGGTTEGVIGGQVLGFNTGSTGISMMGTFSNVAPPAKAISSLQNLLSWKLPMHGLDPSGTASLTCGYTERFKKGTAVTFPVIAGHRDANYTECPGSKLYPLLPGIRAEVARRTQAEVTARLTASEATISPNADGLLDETVFAVRVSTFADWALTLRDSSGGVVATWAGQGTSADIPWDGRDVADGTYAAELTASSTLGDATPAAAGVTVDTAAPRLSSAVAAPETFSPNGDRQSETTAVTYSPTERCAVRVGILDDRGIVRRWLHGWRLRGTAASTVEWDGKLSSGGKMATAPDGRYKFVIERRDAVGNSARQGCKIRLDTTLGFPKASPVTISPNGDGRRDSTTIRFRLTRRATARIRIDFGTETVRTLTLGSLGRGTRKAVFNGKTDSGEALGSGRYTFTVTASSALGESSVTKNLVVDQYRPRLYATKGRVTRRGATVKAGYRTHDPFSSRVLVRYTIVDSRGRRVASASPGWVRSGKAYTVKWRPRARGTYTLIYRATDLGRNRELKSARTTIRVR